MSTSPHSTLDLVFDTAECLAADIATALTEVTPAWGLAAGESPDERHYELLLRTSTYEAWLIYWPAGTGLDMHDHGGSAGAFGVVSGALDEATIDEDGLQSAAVSSADRSPASVPIWCTASATAATGRRRAFTSTPHR